MGEPYSENCIDNNDSRRLGFPDGMKHAHVSIVDCTCFVNSYIYYPELQVSVTSKPWYKADAADLIAIGRAVQLALEAFRHADLPPGIVEPRDFAECAESKRYRQEWNKFVGFGSRAFYKKGGRLVSVEQYGYAVRCQGSTLRADGCAWPEYAKHPEWGAWARNPHQIGEAVLRAAADCLFKVPGSSRTVKEPPL